MADQVHRALRLREGGFVERCHVFPHHGSYSVGKHSFDMLILLEVLNPNPSLDLFRAVLLHDLHERITGDPPGSIGSVDEGVLASMDALKDRVDVTLGTAVELNTDDRAWLKALDKLEFFLWCEDQCAMGNIHVETAHSNVKGWFARNFSWIPSPIKQFYHSFSWRRTRDDFYAGN